MNEATVQISTDPSEISDQATIAGRSEGKPDVTSEKLPILPSYSITGVLGRGGMGVVYEALQRPLNRPVALKMIISGEHAGAEDRLRFLSEAESIAKIQHPGIVQLYEFGSHEGHPYFALEYVAGGTLEKKLSGTPLPPREAATLVEKLARAMQAAHDLGIVHRDLKPANVLLTPAGDPKITDFGLAKSGGSNLTATGAILGTPSYMAPEQADGQKSVGTPADVYALGAILYECLTGRPPFKGPTQVDTILQVVNNEPVSVRYLQASTPQDLETICHKCLAKEPSKRYTTMTTLAGDLRRYLQNEPIEARPISRIEKLSRWTKRNPLVASLVGGIAIVLVLSTILASSLSIWAFRERARADEQYEQAVTNSVRADAKAADAEAERIKAEKATIEANRQADSARDAANRLSISQGMRLAEDGDPSASLLWLTKPCIGNTNLNSPSMENTRLRAASYYSMMPKAILHKIFRNDFRYLTVNHDGRQLLRNNDRQLELYNWIDGSIISINFSSAYISSASVHFPYAIVVSSRRSSNGFVYIFDFRSRTYKSVNIGFNPGHASMLPDGQHALVYSEYPSTPQYCIIDLASSTVLTKSDTDQYAIFKATLSGRLMSDNAKYYLKNTGNAIYLCNISDNTHVDIGKIVRYRRNTVICTAFSPDGTTLLLSNRDEGKLFLIDTSNPSRVSIISDNNDNSIITYGFIFSPNGAYFSAIDSNNNVQLFNYLTMRRLSHHLSHSERIDSITFSPDSRLIASVCADKSIRIWNIQTGKLAMPPIQYTNEISSLQFTNDGKYLLALDYTFKEAGVCIWDISTSYCLGTPLESDHPYLLIPSRQHKATGPSEQMTLFRRIYNMDTSNYDRQVRRLYDVVNCDFMGIVHEANALFDSSHLQREWKFFSNNLNNAVYMVYHDELAKNIVTCVQSWSFRGDNPRLTQSVFGNWRIYQSYGKDLGIFTDNTNSRFAITGGQPYSFGEARIIDSETGRLFCQPIRHNNYVNGAAFGNRGLLATVTGQANEGEVYLWSLPTGKQIGDPIVRNKRMEHVTFNSKASQLSACCDDGKVLLINIAADGLEKHRELTHDLAVSTSAFSPSDQRIVTGSQDKTARVWDTKSGILLLPPLVHRKAVEHVSFSDDGNRIITTGESEPLRLWDSTTGQPLLPPWPEPIPQAVAYSKDVEYVLGLSSNGQLIQWKLPVHRPVQDIVDYAEVNGSRHMDENGGLLLLSSRAHYRKYLDLLARWPEAFSPSQKSTRLWREEQIRQSMNEGNLTAAFYHRDWLIAEMVLLAKKQLPSPAPQSP
ncbi:MAG TPA: WD40 repeat domain-containing serine/threonine-protein kinase [Gemmatales bacterium]|nr:WD40 repeat domain-containing serine/threonine-protein kinase [Gemmatales bacterium]